MRDEHGWHHGGIPDNYPDDALDLKKIYISMKTGEEKSSVHLMYFYYSEKSGFFKITSYTRRLLFRVSLTEFLVHSQHSGKLTQRYIQNLLIGEMYQLIRRKMMPWDRRTRGTGRIFGTGPAEPLSAPGKTLKTPRYSIRLP
jgi:hypothetical protein